MPHPIPIFVGATLAVIGSGYAFKKFVYDPHLAPLIDALIAQHRENRRQRHGYEAVPVPVQSSPEHQRQAPSSGRSTALDQRSPRHRRPAEMYELDDARVVGDEKSFMPPPRPRCPDGRMRSFDDHPVPAPHRNDTPRSPPSPPPMAQPVPHRVISVPPIQLINVHTPSSPEAAEVTPTTARPNMPSLQAPDLAERAEQLQPSAQAETREDEAAVASPSRRSSRSTVILDHSGLTSPAPGSYTSSPVSSSMVSSPARQRSPTLASISSPTFGSISSTSAAPTVSDDLEVISVSGTTTSYVDAETYTPRSPLSPSTPLSRAMSPPITVDIPALSLENLAVLSMPALPAVATAPSVSSWGEDEHWRSDSEWDALSDAGVAP